MPKDEKKKKKSSLSKLKAQMIDFINNIDSYEDWDRFVNMFMIKFPERKKKFLTDSGIDIKRLYRPEDIKDIDYERDIGYPSVPPFVRGVYPTMHRGRFWTQRLIAGTGTPEDTNKRLKFLISQGQTGLNVIYDLPSHRGIDPDDSRAKGEIGKDGVNCCCLEDQRAIFKDIEYQNYSVSQITAIHVLAMYIAMAELDGVDISKLRGTVQSDMFNAIQGCGALASDITKRGKGAVDYSVDICVDIIEFCSKYMPKWYPISIVGRNIREAGADAVSEIGLAFSNGLAFIDKAIERGLDINEFGERLSFMFCCENDFFEEIAKFRAARKVWYRLMKEKGATNPLAMLVRMHVQNSSIAYTAQQPLNNIIRGTLHTSAAVLGGAQSLHTNAYDEAWGLPTEKAARIALRTQQIIAEESGIMNTIDPLAGSYYIEWLTRQLEDKIYNFVNEMQEKGGSVKLTENGWIANILEENAYKIQREIQDNERIVVGVNKYVLEDEELDIEIHEISEKVADHQIARVKKVRNERDNTEWEKAMTELKKACDAKEKDRSINIMRPLIEAYKAGATLGECYDTIWPKYRFMG
ncbi:MAG: methylmalonyl-CoA mutase [Promethearchaeota archaeon]|nr:MAG: methylmalonyl-CoA mutase [Candidatus Lokiarchaeota archaeon]